MALVKPMAPAPTCPQESTIPSRFCGCWQDVVLAKAWCRLDNHVTPCTVPLDFVA